MRVHKLELTVFLSDFSLIIRIQSFRVAFIAAIHCFLNFFFLFSQVQPMQTGTRAPLTEHVPVPSANTNIQRRQAGKYCLFFLESSGDL